jgi:hypothetical protein
MYQTTLDQMKRLVETFAPYAQDRGTLDELHRMISDQRSWHMAHDLFNRIRRKGLAAVRNNDARAARQYSFEEICAKTLFNLTNTEAPFDPDSPYWVVPFALRLGRCIGIPDDNIVEIVAGAAPKS